MARDFFGSPFEIAIFLFYKVPRATAACTRRSDAAGQID